MNKAPSKVLVVHKVQDDLTPAENFGQLIFVNSRYVYGDEIEDELPKQFRDRLVEAVRGFRPDDDYLLIVGDHLQVVTMSALLARAYKRFRVLRYDRQLKGYFPVLIDAR